MSLESLRKQIDETDAEIVRLLNQRAQTAHEIGKVKADSESQVYVPHREKQVLDRVCAAGQGPLPEESLRAIYTEIMSACRALEHRPRVAFLGPRGTFSQQGVMEQFGSQVDLVDVRTIRSVFKAVEQKQADFGLVPIENSAEGGIGETMDALVDTPLIVCGEVSIPIHHNLMGKGLLDYVKRIYSKLPILEQCGEWLAANMPNAELVEVASSSIAAERAASEEDAAAIGHQEAARIYGLKILQAHVEDDPRNTTRFLVLGRHPAGATGNDRTSIVCFIKDEVGALLRILAHFNDHGVNLSFIESRPTRRKIWDYCFFIDLEGHVEDAPVAAAIEEVRKECRDVKLLGSYPVSR